MGKGGKGDPGWNPPAEKQKILQMGKVQGRVHPKLKHIPTNANTPCGCLRPAGEFLNGFFMVLGSILSRFFMIFHVFFIAFSRLFF